MNGIISSLTPPKFLKHEGVSQCEILSADLYKTYLNSLMDRIQLIKIGARIGNILCNQSGCANDMTLNSNEKYGLQKLTDIAVYYSGLELCLSCSTTKSTKWHVRPVKTQISLGIRPVWSASSLCTQWVAKDPRFLHADSEDWSDWADAEADLSVRRAHRSFGWFCRAASYLLQLVKSVVFNRGSISGFL